MRLCWSSASYWPQTKVTLFVKSISLVLFLGLFLGLDTAAVHLSPVQVHRNTQQLHYCDFTSSTKVYSIQDLLKCMNKLASMMKGQRRKRSTDKEILFFPNPLQSKRYAQYSPYLESPNYNTPSINLQRDYSHPANRPGYYKYPPALPPGYPLSFDSSSTSGILGINLVDALSSISQYDDLKCVPRIICEVATGVIPGNSVYKQSYTLTGMNPLISLLTAVNSGDTSPLLNFGRSALMGYTNRGNPEICYRQYSKCPRNPSDVVNYLNNHNGGFFRFFNNHNKEIGYHVKVGDAVMPPSYNSVSDRKGTGELKFDTVTPTRSKSLKYPDNKPNSKTILFPDDQRHFNRLIKSFDYEYENFHVTQKNPTFFPQDRMDLNIPDQSQLPNEEKNSYNKSNMTEAKVYLLENASNQNYKSFIFPDGQNVVIDMGFSKLFNEGYKKMLKRGLIMNDIPQPMNFKGLNVINLPELYTEDDTPQYIQVIHPCDMICHDSRGTAIQFHQIINSRGTLSTVMAPEQSIVDLSTLLPCEIICMTGNGERQQLSTTLNKVLRSSHPHHYEKLEVDKSTNRFKRFPRFPLRNKIMKPRFIGDTYMRTNTKKMKSPYNENSPQLPQIVSSMDRPYALPVYNVANYPGATYNNQWQNQFPTPSTNDQRSLNGVVIGENPLVFGMTVKPQSVSVSGGGDITPIPATVIMCGEIIYFIPANSQTVPMCGISLDSLNGPTTPHVLYEPKNLWGNYTNFLAQYTNITDYGHPVKDTDIPTVIEDTTVVLQHTKPTLMMPPTEPTTMFPSTYSESTALTMPPTPPMPPAPPRPSTHSPVLVQSEILDYQQQSSCLEGESWDSIDHQCVPVKYHKDAEYDYPDMGGSNWEKISVNKRDGESQKIVIMTPDADMYIKSI